MMSDARLKKMQVDNKSLNESSYLKDQISELHLKSKSINLQFRNTSLLDLLKRLETL